MACIHVFRQCRRAIVTSLTRAYLQHVEADLADPLRLVHAELENRYILARAFVTQHTPAMPTVVFPHGERELGPALLAQVALRPRRLRRQHVQQTMEQLLCCHLIIKYRYSVLVLLRETSARSHQHATHRALPVHIR